jgi:hypothetical protein
LKPSPWNSATTIAIKVVPYPMLVVFSVDTDIPKTNALIHVPQLHKKHHERHSVAQVPITFGSIERESMLLTLDR